MIYFNQAYRAEKFFGIDFPNSFVWGDPTVTKMENPSCAASSCVASDVVAGSSAMCSSVKERHFFLQMSLLNFYEIKLNDSLNR